MPCSCTWALCAMWLGTMSAAIDTYLLQMPCVQRVQPFRNVRPHCGLPVVRFLAYCLQVYLASSAPPVRFPNVYGVDMPNRKEFVADGLTEAEVGGGHQQLAQVKIN